MQVNDAMDVGGRPKAITKVTKKPGAVATAARRPSKRLTRLTAPTAASNARSRHPASPPVKSRAEKMPEPKVTPVKTRTRNVLLS